MSEPRRSPLGEIWRDQKYTYFVQSYDAERDIVEVVNEETGARGGYVRSRMGPDFGLMLVGRWNLETMQREFFSTEEIEKENLETRILMSKQAAEREAQRLREEARSAEWRAKWAAEEAERAKAKANAAERERAAALDMPADSRDEATKRASALDLD